MKTPNSLIRTVWLAALLLLVAMCHPLYAQNTSNNELMKTRERVWRAFFDGDTETLQQLLPTDTIVISAGSPEWKSQEDVLHESERFHGKRSKLVRLEFPRTEVQRFENVALIYSQYVYETEDGAGKRETTQGRVIEVFVLRGGRWVNPGWHSDKEH